MRYYEGRAEEGIGVEILDHISFATNYLSEIRCNQTTDQPEPHKLLSSLLAMF